MKLMKKLFSPVMIILALTLVTTLSGCTEAERTSNHISHDADSFKTPRSITVINTRNDEIIFKLIGTFSIQSSDGDLDIICAVGKDKYEKHFIRLNEWTIYIVEDLTNNGGDLYYRKIEYYPERIIHETNDINNND